MAMIGSSKRRGIDRFARLQKIEGLDVETHYREITLLFYADFQSVMMTKGFNGFLFTYASPRISAVLEATGEVERRLLKRILDTSLLASAVMEHGLRSEQGRAAARRVNAMHSRYSINPEDFVAVGAEEALGSIDLAERYGWRPVSNKEREALRLFYGRQAAAFGSTRPFPATLEALKAFFDNYNDRELRFENRNKKLAEILVGFYGSLVPKPLRPVFTRILLADVDPRMLAACGLRRPPPPLRWAARAFLKANGRKDPLPDGAPNPLEAMARQVYPDGWTIEKLGTHTGSDHRLPAEA